MKKNTMMRVASALLVAVLLTTCAISGTFAKYVTEVSDSSSARVAKWDVSAVAQGEDTFAFDLFETVNDTNVATGNGENIIAPGTEGEFSIVLHSENEVTADWTVAYTVTNTANIPVEFSVDGGNTWTAAPTNDGGTINVGGTLDKTITVQWRWVFEGVDDDFDTDLGELGTDTITVSATVTFTQVN